MDTTFSNNQKNGRSSPGAGLVYVNMRKNSKNRRPVPSEGGRKGGQEVGRRVGEREGE